MRLVSFGVLGARCPGRTAQLPAPGRINQARPAQRLPPEVPGRRRGCAESDPRQRAV